MHARSGVPAGPDVFLTYGDGWWEYLPQRNAWRKTVIAEPPMRAGQNRAMVYDARRDLTLLVFDRNTTDPASRP